MTSQVIVRLQVSKDFDSAASGPAAKFRVPNTQAGICEMRHRFTATALAALMLIQGSTSSASDHLDTRTVIEDPRADIGDLFAWTSYDAKRLNLVMTIVGHTFSDQLEYVFHIDSGARFGKTTATTRITCRILAPNVTDCDVGDLDSAEGDAGGPNGLESQQGHFRVFAGMRDDPFFNNVKGSRDAYQRAAAGTREGARKDSAGCTHFDQATSKDILNRWRHTDGGPGANFLKGWTPASLIVSIDLNQVNAGGPMLAVWGTTATPDKQLDRMGRPLTGNALLAPLAADGVSDGLKARFNESTPATSAQFIPEIEKTLGLYDSFDGQCGNQWLADRSQETPLRYRALAELLADDRLWVNSESTLCMRFFAVELATVGGQSELTIDCGGRTPNYDAVDVYRSLLANGTIRGVDDGVDRDEKEHSISAFPFLASP
jgi:hypothetical protein